MLIRIDYSHGYDKDFSAFFDSTDDAFDRVHRLLVDIGLIQPTTSSDTVADLLEALICNNVSMRSYAFDVHSKIDAMYRGFYYNLGAFHILNKPMDVEKFNVALSKANTGWQLADKHYACIPDTVPEFVKLDASNKD